MPCNSPAPNDHRVSPFSSLPRWLLWEGRGTILKEHVDQLQVQPPALASEGKGQLRSNPSPCVLFTWKNDSRRHHAHRSASDCNNRPNFSIKVLRLLLKAAQPEDSGTYSLEVTFENSTVRTHLFHVSVMDPVGKPELQLLEQTAALGSGKCRVTLNCSASGGGDVTYTWYRGGKRIPTPRSSFRLEEQVDANSGPNRCLKRN
ncbi:Natural killer cell receptor 2B4 [Myotis davidii]|uniref:Natural killer cell receptor 2B4 n=1 Tax=Myotis davidii TaxID=225400 RepID=L5LTZ3_MYODS|nr:Natural killer cell receptor 2B4 [Myotis davidii]